MKRIGEYIRFGFWSFALLIALLALALQAIRRHRSNLEMQGEIRQVERELRELKREKRDLARDQKNLQTDAYRRERDLRQQGRLGPGEELLVSSEE